MVVFSKNMPGKKKWSRFSLDNGGKLLRISLSWPYSWINCKTLIGRSSASLYVFLAFLSFILYYNLANNFLVIKVYSLEKSGKIKLKIVEHKNVQDSRSFAQRNDKMWAMLISCEGNFYNYSKVNTLRKGVTAKKIIGVQLLIY